MYLYVTMTFVVCMLHRRIADNPLQCDCRLSWLSKWLRLHPTLGLFTRCASPHGLRGRELVELQQSSFVCTDGKTLWKPSTPLTMWILRVLKNYPQAKFQKVKL